MPSWSGPWRLPTWWAWSSGSGAPPCRDGAPERASLVDGGLDLVVVDVVGVVPEVAGVGLLVEGLALEGPDGGLHRLVAHVHRVLGDRPGHHPAPDRVDLRLAGVEAHDRDLAGHVELVDGVDHADRRALVGAEDPGEVGVGADDGPRDVGGLQVVAPAVLDVDDLHVAVVLLD